ncbi:S41 family peptidase [Anaeropeptidivorans aminofermentans]|uniref:S41 family peptidase n=1 Tax=Anaeropeptidivorans aminofermentans TaxID=2934315 RepID=UPI002023F46A|nr:S41 family peptidase [Anaeropeptidivorans aminofermentans]
MMKSRNLFYTNEYEKKYKRLRIIFIVLLILFGIFIYKNINYILFKYFVSYNYAYTDALDNVYIDALGEDNFKSYAKNFDEMVIAVVSDHIGDAAEDRYTYLYTPSQYKDSKEKTKEKAEEAEIKELNEDTVYLYLPNMSKYTTEFAKENKENYQNYKNIVIDLRDNTGGALDPTYELLDYFLPKGKLMAAENTRLFLTSRKIKSKNNTYFEYENIILLENSNTASAAETFIMALKENLDNVTVMGEKSFGKGIGQYTLSLKGGYAVKATVMELETPSGNSIHKSGIEPDVKYVRGDVIKKALSYINSK